MYSKEQLELLVINPFNICVLTVSITVTTVVHNANPEALNDPQSLDYI